jgi:hypothetical protein
MAVFEFLIRFKTDSGDLLYGEAGKPTSAATIVGSIVKVYEGTAPWDPDLHLTEKVARVSEGRTRQMMSNWGFLMI